MNTKEYMHEYYLKHKQEIDERSKKWRQDNKERFYKLVYKSRKKKADVIKEKGELYCWHSDIERKKLYERRDRRINQSNRDGEIQNQDNEN